MGTDDYALGRDYRASARLHLQHHLWSETFGYYLNPSIPSSKKGLAIADVGTGTGIWLLELDRRLPISAARLCGLDISGDQFPRPEWLPPNAQFIEHDAFDPAGPPTELRGKFDVVHLRLFIAIIKYDDPTPVLDFCYKLLKPSGFLQWDEGDPSVNLVCGHNDSPTEGMSMISQMIQNPPGHRSTRWINRLPKIFQERGFDIIDIDRKVILPWQRGMYADSFCMLADEFVERSERGNKGNNPVESYFRELPTKASAEKLLGSYMELTLQTVVGKKI